MKPTSKPSHNDSSLWWLYFENHLEESIDDDELKDSFDPKFEDDKKFIQLQEFWSNSSPQH